MASQNLDLLVVALYLFTVVALSFKAYRKNHTFGDFTTSYDNTSIPGLVCSFLASSLGFITTSYLANQIYSYGEKWIYLSLLMYFTGLSTLYFYRKIPRDIKACRTLPEVIGVKFGKQASKIMAFVLVPVELGVMLAQYMALKHILEFFFDFPQFLGIAISGAAVAIAAALGGLRVIFQTSIIQGFTLIVLIPLCISYTLAFNSDFKTILLNLPHIESSTPPELGKFALLCVTLKAMFPITSSPFIQRILIAREPQVIRKVLSLFITVSLVLGVSMIFIGLYVRSLGVKLESTGVLLYFVSTLPPVLKALMISGLVSLVTLHMLATINNLAGVIANDILRTSRRDSNKQKLRIYRSSVIIISMIPLFLIDRSFENFYSVMASILKIWEPMFLSQITLIFFGYQQSTRAFYSAMLVGLSTSFFAGALGFAPGYLGIAVGATANSMTSLIFGYLDGNFKQFKLPRLDINLPTLLNSIAPEVRFRHDRYATFTMAFNTLLSMTVGDLSNPHLIIYSAGLSYLFAAVLFMRDQILPRKFRCMLMPSISYLGFVICTPFAAMILIFASGNILTMLAGVFLLFSAFLFTDYKRAIFYSILGVALYLIIFSIFPYQPLATQNEAVILGLVALILSIYITYLQFQKSSYEERFYRMLSGAIAHEIMTPVTAMTLSSDTIQMLVESEDYQDIPQFTQRMSESGHKAAAIVRSLLSAFKPEDGTSREISALCVVMEAVANFKKVDSKISIEINADKDFMVKASFDKLYLVVFNILKNAARHGGKARPINISLSNRCITITDYGKGIREDQLELIFEPFYTSGGTGIGLALCDKIMGEIGGIISCRSKQGEFTTFSLKF